MRERIQEVFTFAAYFFAPCGRGFTAAQVSSDGGAWLLLVDLYIESHPTPLEQSLLDLGGTDIPLYSHHTERFFHGYYDGYCYLPLYIFDGDQLPCARLHPANQDAAAGSLKEVETRRMSPARS